MVPQPDHRLGPAIFVSEYTYACCGQQEKSPGGGFQPKPGGREHAQKMAGSHFGQDDVAIHHGAKCIEMFSH